MITVRNATTQDLPRILDIYSYYVEHTAISFEWVTPSLEEMAQRMKKTTARYPYFVAERDGVVEGYAYIGPFVGRTAYDWCCETTIYLAPTARKTGMGRMLYEALEGAAKKMGILNMYACIGYPEVEDEYLTCNSAQFHAHLGYKQVGLFYNCGHKFDRWYHMIWMEKLLAPHGANQPPVVPYPEVK